jgi:hypothetical protein
MFDGDFHEIIQTTIQTQPNFTCRGITVDTNTFW